MSGQAEIDEFAHGHAQARSLADGGDLTGARTLLEQVLAGGELALGPEDLRLAPVMVDLATIARRLGNLTEARHQLRRAYAIVVTASGPEHATSLSIEGRLAAVVYRLGEPTEAYDWHLTDAGRRVLGTDHPAVRGAERRLASRAGVAPYVPAYAAVAEGVYRREFDIDEVVAELPELTVEHRSGRAGGAALLASLIAVVLIAGILVAYQLLRPSSGSVAPVPDPGRGPSTITVPANPVPRPTASPAPTRVLLRDDGGAVTLSWDDPSAGRVAFIISGGRDGQALLALTSVPAGRTKSTIYGLNVNYNYCFTVSAVWSFDNIQPSIRTCTFRSSPSASSLALGSIDRLQ